MIGNTVYSDTDNEVTSFYNYFSNYEDAIKPLPDVNNEGVTWTSTIQKFWQHPPRSGYFKLLELNSYPYYKFNRDNWTWSLEVSGQWWGDKRWVAWNGNTLLKYKYHISYNKQESKN